MSTVAVTGSTGRVGGRVARQLAAAGVRQRLIVRDSTRAPVLPHAGVAVAEYRDKAASVAALKGVEILFMVSAQENPERVTEHRTFIDAAAAAGVANVLYLSFFGARPDATFLLARDHWATEQYLRTSGMACVVFRDNLYADSIPRYVQHDVLRCPAGNGRAALVAIADVADAVTTVLRDVRSHVGRTYNLTGPQSLTMREVADTVSLVTGRTTTFINETRAEAYASRAHYNAPSWLVDGWVSSYLAIAAGEMDGVTTDVNSLTGHPATALADVLRAAG